MFATKARTLDEKKVIGGNLKNIVSVFSDNDRAILLIRVINAILQMVAFINQNFKTTDSIWPKNINTDYYDMR